MKQSGRMSAAGLMAVSTGPLARVAPPDRLALDEAAIWREITATKPADWFGGDSVDMLETLCVCIAQQRRIAARLREIDPCHEVYERLLAMQAKLASQQKALSTSMRLTQQSRYGARGASGVSDRTAKQVKPWERAAS